MSLTDYQLRSLGKRMKFEIASISFKDDLPSKFEYNKAYIINLEDEYDENGNPNMGSHWTCFQINKYPNNKVDGIYFDSYGVDMAEDVRKYIKRHTKIEKLAHTTKNVQSLMNNACGWYVCAFLHFINSSQYRSKHLYNDVESFLDVFDDLNTSIDFKKNEYILKHFFQSEDIEKRTPVEIDTIVEQDKTRPDLMKIPVNVNVI